MDLSRDNENGINKSMSSDNYVQITHVELQKCENSSNDQYSGCIQVEQDVHDRNNEDSNILDCENNEENVNIFGEDWLGKPGVSSDSESDDFFKDSDSTYNTKKIVRGRPLPPNIDVLDGEPVSYKCKICVKTFGSKGHVRYHAYCGQSDKPYKCRLCPKSFSKKTVLNYHIKTHTGEKPFACLICDKKFLQLDKLKRHKRIHFGNNVECDNCGAKFRDIYSLNVHKRTHSQSNLYTFKCSLCSKSFKDKSVLNKHVKGVHSESKKFVCEHCGKAFDWKYNLVCHIRTHSGVRAFSCDQCNRTFKNQNGCYKHKMTHTDEKDYRCNICDGAFKRRDNLVRHLRNIHPEQVQKNITKISTHQPRPSTSNSISNDTASNNINRISVIQILNRAYSNEPAQQSVIRHSRNTASQECSTPNNIRECVIKSTR